MNENCCNPKIKLGCDSCGSCGSCCDGGCTPAKFDCAFSIESDAYDNRYWYITQNGCTNRVRLPEMPEKETFLDFDCSSKTMTYYGEKETQTFAGSQLGCLINLEDLSNTNISDPAACSMLVFNPGCGRCPCTPEEATWQAYQIPDAGDCEIEPDDDGYYKVLTKNECGCVEECRLPVVPSGFISLNYMRDSVPDDPDFPWYYGCYNDTINLHLAENAAKYFGKYALKITVNYGIQACKSDVTPGYNFRSLVVPVVDGESVINVEKEASVLQGFAIYSENNPQIPWGTMELRGSFTFVVPKGKEAALHHEYRLRTSVDYNPDWQNWTFHALDGQKVPDDVASQVDKFLWAGSRLHSLQIIVEPTMGTANFDPVVDAERNQLDAPVDEYPIN